MFHAFLRDLLETGSSIAQHVRSRVVWLVASAIGGLVAASLMGVFRAELEQYGYDSRHHHPVRAAG